MRGSRYYKKTSRHRRSIPIIPLKDTIPSSRIPYVNYGLIALNCAVFLYQLALGERLTDFVYTYGVIPFRFLQIFPRDPGELLTPLSAMFLHGGWMHLLGNMLYLHIFGNNVEDMLGRGRYLLFYLTCGGLSFLSQIAFQSNSMVPNIGASGAIAGVLGAYFLLFPRARVLTLVPLFLFFPVVEIPAFFFLGFWFLMQFLSGAATIGKTSALTGGVAWWAHIGGFLVGMLLLKLLLPHDSARRPVIV
ncbi:MAG: peptidase S54, rhomboid domain-containing protein [Deltaproteobacteria bacterium CSP1-8]|nr:MAG: peptidase S54, rhomboid domain-containing protein [Deltaproteobacteria bacterium CSP1-8]